MNTFERVRRLLSNITGVEEKVILPQTRLISLDADSLLLTEFIMEWEEQEKPIELPDSEADQLLTNLNSALTVQDVVNWIERNGLA